MKVRKILIVDDDADMRRGLQIRLKSLGYQVAQAADAVSAVAVAQRERPDVILLDLGLPGGDGFLVIERLQALLPVSHIPIVVLTARAPEGNEDRARSLGARSFLQKPVENEALLVAIQEALGE